MSKLASFKAEKSYSKYNYKQYNMHTDIELQLKMLNYIDNYLQFKAKS